MQEVRSPKSSSPVAQVVRVVCAATVVSVLVGYVALSVARKPAEEICRARDDEWLKSSLQFYFDNTSLDEDRTIELLPGAKWNQRFHEWEVELTHTGKKYSAIVTCHGDVKHLRLSRNGGSSSALHAIWKTGPSSVEPA
jgi:hypothetical protein